MNHLSITGATERYKKMYQIVKCYTPLRKIGFCENKPLHNMILERIQRTITRKTILGQLRSKLSVNTLIKRNV